MDMTPSYPFFGWSIKTQRVVQNGYAIDSMISRGDFANGTIIILFNSIIDSAQTNELPKRESGS
jgi:hypothetical protein